MKKAFVASIGLMCFVLLGVAVVAGCKPEDTEAPTITLRVEATDNYRSEYFGDSIKGVVAVIATATDNVGIKQVQFFVDGLEDWQPMEPLTDSTGKVTSDEYVYLWDTKLLGDSVVYSIMAAAYDEAGNADTTDPLTFLIRIPNEPPNPVEADSMYPANNAVITDSAAIVRLAWWGSDPDTLPRQVPLYSIYFGTSASSLEKVADSIQHKEDTLTTWSTFNLGYYLVPETDYYWMVRSTDPYGQFTDGPVFKFTRPENNPPYKTTAGSQGADTLRTVDPADSIMLSWYGGDPDADSVFYDLYFGEGPGWDNVSKVASRLTVPQSYVQVSPGKTYYWRPISTDQWNAIMDTTNARLWTLIVNPE